MTVVSVETTPVGRDVTGEICHGLLVLNGKCLLGTIITHPGNWERDFIQIPTPEADIILDRGHIHLDDRPVANSIWKSDKTNVLLIKVDEYKLEYILQRNWLILHETGTQTHLYERVGLLKTWDDLAKPKALDELFAIAQEMTVNII